MKQLQKYQLFPVFGGKTHKESEFKNKKKTRFKQKSVQMGKAEMWKSVKRRPDIIFLFLNLLTLKRAK